MMESLTGWQALILGIVEGLTEFLPVSSTFHLLLTSQILNIPLNQYTKLFEIFIQSGAILAVIWNYRREIFSRFDLVAKTALAFIPTVLLGIGLYGPIKNIFMMYIPGQIYIFIFMGFLFLLFEFLVRRGLIKLTRTINSLKFHEALIIGSLQGLAFFPGVSRAGAVILAMMLFGYRRSEAAFFSFFLAIPTIMGAAAFDLYKSRAVLISFRYQILPLSLGFVVSFVVALVAIRWFLGYLRNHSLNLFAFYRFMIGLLACLWLFLK
jgi:undecaprenyl-diphosphatase